MGASAPRTLAAIVFLLALAGAQADLTDVNDRCAGNAEPSQHITYWYCVVTHKTDQTLGHFLRHTRAARFIGWVLVLLYHVLSTTKKVAEKYDEKCKFFSEGATGIGERMRLDELARIVRLLGQNILVYMCYYSTDKEHMWISPLRYQPFMHSLVLIMIDVVVLWGITAWIEALILKCIGSNEGEKHDMGVAAVVRGMCEGYSSEEDTDNRVWEFGTIFTLHPVPPLRYVLTWFSQTVLFFYYVLVMNQISTVLEDDASRGRTLMWLIGVVIMATLGEKESGASFDRAGWYKIWDARKKGRYNWGTQFRVGLRYLFDWSVNSIYRQVLLATTPILLSTEEPLDFIKDVLAIMFISTLDDPTDEQVDQAKEAFYAHANEVDPRTVKKSEIEDFLEDNGNISTSKSAEYMWEMMDKEAVPLGVGVAWRLWRNMCSRWLCGSTSDNKKPLLRDAVYSN